MAGETQLLELRRHYHCAAYNCAIAAISCSFNEPKFYYDFLFSEKPEKVLTGLFNYMQLSSALWPSLIFEPCATTDSVCNPWKEMKGDVF